MGSVDVGGEMGGGEMGGVCRSHQRVLDVALALAEVFNLTQDQDAAGGAAEDDEKLGQDGDDGGDDLSRRDPERIREQDLERAPGW